MFGTITVTVLSTSEENGFIRRELIITDDVSKYFNNISYCIVLYCIVLYCIVLYCIVLCTQKSNSITVSQFQFTNWQNFGICKAPQTILKVLECIGKIQRKSGKGSIIVHCR